MNILAFESAPSTDFGGSERSYFDVLTGLRARGHNVTMYYKDDGNLVPKYEAAGVSVVRVDTPYMLRSGQQLSDLLKMLASARKLRAGGHDTIVYINFAEALPIAALLRILYGYPVVCHIRMQYWKLSRHITWSARLASRLIVINKKFKPDFERGYGKKVAVIYNGLTIPASLPQLRKKPAARVLRLVYLGRIAPEKGVSELVNVCARLASGNFQLMLTITGNYVASHSGDYREELGKMITACNAESIVRITPAVDNPIPYLSEFDLFVFPSTWDEPFGRTVPESILAGTAVLARRVGMIEEVMADNPDFVFDSDEEMASKICDFYEGRLSFDFQKARKRVESEFNKERTIVEVEEVLRKSLRV